MDTISNIMKAIIEEVKATTSDESRQNDIIKRVFEDSLPDITGTIMSSLEERSHYMLAEQRYIHDEFSARLNHRWFEAFDLLEKFIVISYELGEDIGKNGKIHNTTDTNYLFDILLRLHARGIQVAKEILVLMRNGFADGAMARWRTLYEIAIIALFISKNGNKTARMYKDYNEVESYKEMTAYIENYERLGFQKLDDEEIERQRKNMLNLTSEYGSDFLKTNGWTKDILDKKNRTFEGIEQFVEQDFLRPFYKWACNAVHAGPKAAYYRIGDMGGTRLLFAGPTNFGFADPGQSTALSLLQITSTLVLNFMTFDNLVVVNILGEYFEKLKAKFAVIQEALVFEEEVKNEDC